jgi:tripeptidyl-peptidase-1
MKIVAVISVVLWTLSSSQNAEVQFPSQHRLMEKSNIDKIRGIKRFAKAPAEHHHEVIFAVKHQNLDWLETKLNEVSSPDSPDYGKHMTKDEIAAMVTSPESTETVRQYLVTHGFNIRRETRYGEFIFVGGKILQFEKLFATEFHQYKVYNYMKDTEDVIIRAEHYSLPQELADHVEAAFKTVQFPAPIIHGRPETPQAASPPTSNSKKNKKSSLRTQDDRISSDVQGLNGMVYPKFLNAYYCIPSNTGSSMTTQGVYESLNQTLSPADLTAFQNAFNIDNQAIAGAIHNHVDDKTCIKNSDLCTEANLDVQYQMAIAQQVPTYYYYWGDDDPWVTWITEVSDLADPSDVYSISYSSYEDAFANSELDAWEIQAQMLGLRGTTLVAAVSCCCCSLLILRLHKFIRFHSFRVVTMEFLDIFFVISGTEDVGKY